MLGSYASCSTWVMVVNTNIKDEHALTLCYIFGCLIQDHYALIGTWRTTQENRTTTRHMAQLGWVISDSSVGMTLPDKGKGERQWGIDSL
jgi:hypothetical protein